ncbi:hypothetical protein [Flavobacterium wongokense]|uniref:hypothetical protein n=1 Tax=Flavobacterium wongokense TaxID=2910674 RepID=UPI001F1A8B17|nr:hypothetical protein [Flavobacterium sp. WG47]MCF6130850.1 hypothetical protein [Flavobacterium sp. WG47]
MKKIIAALTLLLAFSINANAQDNKSLNGLNPTEKGAKQAAELSEFLGLDKTMQANFASLFEYKFQVIDDKNAQPERKTEMLRAIEAKIRGTLDGTQIEKLEKNQDLFKRLIN